jgi:hypothetical protein
MTSAREAKALHQAEDRRDHDRRQKRVWAFGKGAPGRKTAVVRMRFIGPPR